MKCQICASL
jgi:hypothetical protein